MENEKEIPKTAELMNQLKGLGRILDGMTDEKRQTEIDVMRLQIRAHLLILEVTELPPMKSQANPVDQVQGIIDSASELVAFSHRNMMELQPFELMKMRGLIETLENALKFYRLTKGNLS